MTTSSKPQARGPGAQEASFLCLAGFKLDGSHTFVDDHFPIRIAPTVARGRAFRRGLGVFFRFFFRPRVRDQQASVRRANPGPRRAEGAKAGAPDSAAGGEGEVRRAPYFGGGAVASMLGQRLVPFCLPRSPS